MADEVGSIPRGLLEQGDPAFVDAIRKIHDADALAAFAEVWYGDLRPTSRRLLLEYLDRPLNAYRHEGLVKRLFKKAEAADDDEVMARFLVLFDRSIRRVHKVRWRWNFQDVQTELEAKGQVSLLQNLGYEKVSFWGKKREFHVSGRFPEQVIRQPRGTTMPRGLMAEIRPQVLAKLEKLSLFRLSTRAYLRRRAWRYFRSLGKTRPDRYVAAVSRALALYQDEDVADGLALMDNWGLMHALFHHSPALEAKSAGWTIKEGHTLGELAPSPIHERLWDDAPGEVVGLLATARSSTVRRWALRRVEADLPRHRAGLPFDGWLALLGHQDPAIVALAVRMLEGSDGLESVGVDHWLRLLEGTDPASMEGLCGLIERHLTPDRVTLEQAVKLTGMRALPVAKLGFAWLRGKSESIRDPAQVLGLIEAESERLRPEILRWLRAILAGLPAFDPSVVLAFLDARQADARAEGWAWFRSDARAFEEVETWRKLLESPHDDIRLALLAELEARVNPGLDPADLRPLWASVLLNIHRGSRAKPGVVRQLLGRLEANPSEAAALVPMLGIALRSVRGPERRAGLVAIVGLVERRAEIEPLVRSSFPELDWIGEPQR